MWLCWCFRSYQKRGSLKTLSIDEDTKAENKKVLEPAELQSRDQYQRRELHLNSCNCLQFSEVEQRTDDVYDLVNGGLVSRVGLAEAMIILVLLVRFIG